MAADGSVIIDILGDDSKFSKTIGGLKDVASGAVKGIAAGAAAATTAVGALAKASLDSYANYEQLVGGVETLFKDSAGIVQQYAADAYKTAGVSANTYMEQATAFSASLIQSLGGDTQAAAEYANQAIMDMSDNANKMGTDIESIQATYQSLMRGNYAMLDNLKLGYGGTKAELERLVADASELTGKALDPSKFSDVITAIHAVQENLGITGTTAKEAATTIEGSLNATKAAWSNLLTGIADDNADFGTLVENFVSSVQTAAQNILPRLQIIFQGIGQLITALAPVIAEALPGLISGVLPGLAQAAMSLISALGSAIVQNFPLLISSFATLLTNIATYLQTNLPQLASSGASIVQSIGSAILQSAPQLLSAAGSIILTLVQGILSSLPQTVSVGASATASFITGLVGAIPQVVQTAAKLIINFVNSLTASFPVIIETGKDTTKSLIDGILSAIPVLVENLPAIITAIVEFIMSALPQILQGGVEILLHLITGIINTIPDLVAQIPQIISAFCNTIAENLPQIVATGIELLLQLGAGIIAAIPQLVAMLPQVITSIISGFLALVGGFAKIGVAIVQGIWNGISGSVQWLWNKLSGWVDSVINFIKGKLGIHSPSRVFRDEVGLMLSRGMAAGITSGEKDVLNAADKMNAHLLSKENEMAKRKFEIPATVTGFEQAYPRVMERMKMAFDASMAATSARMQSVSAGASVGGVRETRTVQTINRNITSTMRVIPDGKGIFELVRDESHRRGKSLVTGEGLLV